MTAQTTESSANNTSATKSSEGDPVFVPCDKTTMQYYAGSNSRARNDDLQKCVTCRIYINQTIESLGLDVNNSFVSKNYL